MSMLPVSHSRSIKLREHLKLIGNTYHGSLTEIVDDLIDGYLNSPVKNLREREAALRRRVVDTEVRLRALEKRG